MNLSTDQLATLANIGALVDQGRRIEAYFKHCPPEDRYLAETALAIAEAHRDLQIAVVEWMLRQRAARA